MLLPRDYLSTAECLGVRSPSLSLCVDDLIACQGPMTSNAQAERFLADSASGLLFDHLSSEKQTSTIDRMRPGIQLLIVSTAPSRSRPTASGQRVRAVSHPCATLS